MGIKEDFMLKALEAGYNSMQIVGYIDEAEHQDGDGYWDQFGSGEQAFEDFQLYINNLIEGTSEI